VTALPTPHALHAAVGKPRRLSYRLHSLFGLKLSLFLAFICATGTLATVSHEIEWLLMPQVRASAAPAQPDWARMWEAARAEHPDGWVRSLGTYDRSDADYFARAAQVALADGRETTLLIDPGTSRVTGTLPPVSFHSFMRGLHYYLFTPGDWGFYAVSALGFVLLGSLITGLIVYKRFWKGLLRRPRFQRESRTWLGDVHRLGALWTLPFLLIISLTSIWYFIERMEPGWESEPPAIAAPLRQAPDGATIASWTKTAQAAMPGLKITSVSLPWSDSDPVVIQGEWRAWLVRERTNAAFIDPLSGRLLGLRVAHELPATERWVHTADPLHFGNFAGLTSKLLWVVFGIGLTGLAVTGAIIHGKRVVSPDPISGTAAWRSALGKALLPSLALIAVVPTWFYLNGWDSGVGAAMARAGDVDGFSLWRDGNRWCASPRGKRPTDARFRLRGGGAIAAEFEGGRFCALAAAEARIIAIE
jgi:uncharacterized iron-regulated membrane protein